MNKSEFTEQLRKSLQGLSEEDIKRSVDFYEEMIDDRIEDGMGEEEAVGAVGTIEEIRSKILEEIPITKIVKEKITPKRDLKVWETVLLIVGAPLWLPLLLALIVVGLSVYLSFWVIILSLYATDLSVLVAGFGTILAAFIQGTGSGILFGIGGGIALIGAAVLLFFGFNQITRGMIYISKKMVLWIKKLFVGGKKDEN